MLTRALSLDPEPRSVRRARGWIAEQMSRIGREDLTDSAELGISELVTNALLHAEPPIVVRLAGTSDHPRVEVVDASTAPPAQRDMTVDGRLTAAIGRGLGIVATYSRLWGADVSENGKVVWFEPAADSEIDLGGVTEAEGEVFDLSEYVEEEVASGDSPDRVTVRLLSLPGALIGRYQIWFEELRRELRLLALNHASDYPFAVEFTELTIQAMRERRAFIGMERLGEVIAQHTDGDVDLDVPSSTGDTMERLLVTLQEADEFCRDQRLLTMPPEPDVVAVRRWYHHEFTNQARGGPPTPWSDQA